MDFTYNSYINLIKLLSNNNYHIISYKDSNQHDKCVILRHDIDYDISKAVQFAEIEERIGVSSTYFVLVTSDFYNIFSKRNAEMLKRINELGHNIGLHFDEVRYPGATLRELKLLITNEAKILESVIGCKINTVSMHRPSKEVLESDMQIPNLINSYGKKYFNEFKYLSDSRRRWREPVEEIITSGEYNRLHILTHAFWYNEEEISIHDSIGRFVNHSNYERYSFFEENITDLKTIMDYNEVQGWNK